MIGRKKDDQPPGVVDLKRYKKEREKAAKKPAPKAPAPSGGSLIGGNPRAKLILGLMALAVLLIFVLPLLRR